MIIRIKSRESTIEIFYEKYLHLHGFLKLKAEDKDNNKEYIIIVQVLKEQTIGDYIITRQKLRNVKMTEYIRAELESELQYVIHGRPIVYTEKDKLISPCFRKFGVSVIFFSVFRGIIISF